MNLTVIRRAVNRHCRMRNARPYERVLQRARSRGGVWMTSQGAYVAWWQRRRGASLKIRVSDGEARVSSDLRDAVFERFPGEFLASNRAACPDSTFSGQLQLVVDVTLARKGLLIDALQREGILNFSIGQGGEFFLSHELDGLLERMAGHLRRGRLKDYDRAILQLRDAVAATLARRGLPLIRVWYHPRVDGEVVEAVFSPRHDVDRAITNVPQILRLERRYGASSSLHLRVSSPFYGDEEIRALDALPHAAEIALHAEFAARARREAGGELAAARADKAHLERVLGRPVAGVSLHGGELTRNLGRGTWRAVEEAGFLYALSGLSAYHLPYRRLNDAGRLGSTYFLCRQFKDIALPYEDYAAAFYEAAARGLEAALAQRGVFVMNLHALYFGPFAYLRRPKNLARSLRFTPTYLARLRKLKKDRPTPT